MWKTYASLLLSFGLSACGFQLQGTHQTLPPQLQQVYIDSSSAPHSAIAPELTVALKNNSVTCLNNPSQALIILNILADNRSSHQAGSGASQETRKYVLTNIVTFDLTDEKGKLLYGPVSVSSNMTHYVYSGQVLGNNQEQATLYQSLQRNVVQQILFKLGAEDVKDALMSIATPKQPGALP